MSTLRTFNLQHPESSNNNIQLAEGGGVSVTAGILTATNLSSTNVTATQVTATNGTFSGNLSVGGVLSYEDVTNVDSTGIGTFRSGIDVTGGNVKIGTTTAGQSEADDLTIATSAHTGMTIRSGTTSKGAVYFSDGTSGDSEFRGVLEYNHSDDHFRIFTAASERLRISGAGQIGMGKAGQVTPNGNSPLTIQESDSNSETICLRATNSGGNGSQPGIVMKTAAGVHIGGIYCDVNSDYMRISTSGTDRLYISNAGNVGINDAAPSEKLNVGGNIMLEGGDQYLYLTNVGTYNAGIYLRGNTSSSYLRSHTTGSFHWEITGSEKMKMDSAGRLMLGTTTEGAVNADNFTVADSGNCGITIRSGTSNSGNLYFSDATSGTGEFDGAIAYEQTDNRMMFFTASTERLRIHPNGNVQVKTDGAQLYGAGTLLINPGSSAGRMDLYGGSTNRGGEIDLYGGSNNDGMILFRSGAGSGQQSERMRLRGAGPHLLIGTGGDITYNEITESGSNAGLVIGSSSMGNGGIVIRNSTTGTGRIYFADNSGSDPGRQRGQINYYHNGDYMIFATAGSERLRITSSGEVNVGGSNMNSTAYAFQISRDLGTPSASGTALTRFRNANSTYSQDLYLKFNNSKDIIWAGGSGNGGMTWDMGNRGYVWQIGGSEKLRITSAGRIGVNVTSPAGQVHIKGNTDESANPSIILDDNGDARRCYVTNTSGDLMLGGIDNGTVQSRLTIHENGNMYHQRLNSSGSLVYQFQTGTSQTSGAASGNTYTEHMAFRQADGMKHGSFAMTIYGDGGDNYMPVLFIRHGYHPTNSSFGGQWFGEMWLNNAGSVNPQSYNHTGYNNWATTSFKYRWDCAHWNAKPTMSIIEHHVNYGRTNIADLEISGTTSYFVMWLLPGVYRVTYSAWDGLNAWWTNNNNVGGALTHREGGGNTTRAVRAYSARDTRYDSNISWGTQGQT